MRVEPKVQRAVTRLAGEMQAEKGESVSISDALWAFIREHRPDLAEWAESKGNGNGNGHDEENGDD